jgi:hypothetical protein
MTGPRGIALLTLCLWLALSLVRAQPHEPFMPGVVYFPPNTPVYGAAIADRPSSTARIVNGRRLLVPDGMADFVGDHFYPQLSTRLILRQLSPALEARIQTYRSQRLLQVTELLNQFIAMHDQADEAWEAQLRDFARTQSAALSALEIEAERLGELLVADGLRNRVDWNAGRRWRIGSLKTGTGGAEAEAEFQVVRAAAHYQRGLLPQQRGLLREVAIELQAVARKARGLPALRVDSDAMFFSPETTRLRLPPGLPPEVREKVGVYNGRKATLKRELRQLVVAQENASAADRLKAFEALADAQWPELSSLELLAEEIRRDLAPRLQIVAPPAPPWIPKGVMEEIRSYNEDRDTYFGEMRQRMESAAALVPKPELEKSPDQRVQQLREHMVAQNEARRQATVSFQEEHLSRFRLLEQRHRMIREMLAVVAARQVDRKTGRPLDADTLLRQYGASMEEFSAFGRESAIYTNYRIAMLQPGLSPEQRRLLLNYALVGLAQPLPYGELLPQKSAKLPYPSF